MRRTPAFFPCIMWQPRPRNTSQFVPTTRHYSKSPNRFAQSRTRELVVRRNKRFRPRKARLQQQPGSFVEPIRNARSIYAVELEVIVMQSMLNNFKPLILAQVTDQLCI